MISAMIVTVLLGQAQAAKPSSPPDPKGGDKVAIRATYGAVPALRSAGDYRAFVSAVKPGGQARIKAMWPDRLILLANGSPATIVRIEAPNNPGNGGREYPGNVPAFVVEVHRRGGATDVVWIPAVYFSGPDGKPHPATSRFPVLLEVPDADAIPEPRLNMIVHDKDPVCVAVGYFEFIGMMKVLRAGDAEGIRQMLAGGRMAQLAPGTRILVVERHVNIGLTGDNAVECRVLDGPLKGKAVWVSEQWTATPDLMVLSVREAERILEQAGKKSPARKKRR